MGISVVASPTIETISIAEAKAQCRVSGDNEDGLIAGYILAARHFAESNTRKTLLEHTFSYTIDFGWPYRHVRYENFYPYRHNYGFFQYQHTRVELPKAPVLAPASVLSVQYVDESGVTQTLDPTQYVVVTDNPVAYIEPAFNILWPIPRCQPHAITIQFKAGFGTSAGSVPEQIRQGMLLLIAHWFDTRAAIVMGKVATEIPYGIEALLSQERQSRILA